MSAAPELETPQAGETKVDPQSDPKTTAGKIADFDKRRAAAAHAASDKAVEKQHSRGKATARERIDMLRDEGSFVELDALARHRSNAFDLPDNRPYGDGVVTGYGTVDGRPVCVFAQDFTIFGGSLGEVYGEKIVKVMDLAMSVVLRPVAPEQSWGWLPLLAGVAVADALMAQGVPAALKWPNDVVVDGPARDGSPGPRKLGGLLAERVENAIVVGIGINVDLREDELPVGRATSTWLEGSHVTRESLVVDILENLRKRYATWQGAVGDAARCGLATDYSERCVTVGREVRAHVPGDRFVEGTATHIDEHGRLVIRLADGSTHAMSAGDVEHLR